MPPLNPQTGRHGRWADHALRGVCWVGVLLLCTGAVQALEPSTDDPPAHAAPEAPMLDEAEETQAHDEAARVYAMKCMGCHTIGGGALSGPDLKVAATFPRHTVVDAIWRMEQQVGPMTEEEVELLTDLLLDENAAQRLEAQRDRVRMREAATLDPPDAARGEALYFGRTAFRNGGLSCAACHQAGGRGGNLASSLEDSYTRLGAESLLSTTENPGFPVMRAIYEDHPVTRQEALHVVAYLEEVSEDPAPPFSPPLHVAGLVGALGLMAVLGRKRALRAAGTRARLVSEANRRGTTPHSRERGTR